MNATNRDPNNQSSRPRVAAFGPVPPPINGMSMAFGTLIKGLPGLGWHVDVIDLADRTGRARSRFTVSRAREALSIAGAAVQRARLADVCYVTLAQSPLGFLKDSLILLSAMAANVPIVVHLHGGNFRSFYSAQTPAYRWYVRRMLEKVSRFIVLGDSLIDQFHDVPGAAERTTIVLNPTVLPVGTARSAPQSPYRLLFVSNLMVEKGYLDAVEAVRLLAMRHPTMRFHLDLAGALTVSGSFRNAAEMEKDLRRHMAVLPENASAHWHGVVSGPDKTALFDNAHIFLLPTYYVNEGQPIAIIEALTSGLPVITTRYRSIPDLLPTSAEECYVPPRDAHAIAASAGSILLDEGRYARLSRESIAVSQRFRPEAHVHAIDSVLRAAIENS